jgi:hypothetical protein
MANVLFDFEYESVFHFVKPRPGPSHESACFSDKPPVSRTARSNASAVFAGLASSLNYTRMYVCGTTVC